MTLSWRAHSYRSHLTLFCSESSKNRSQLKAMENSAIMTRSLFAILMLAASCQNPSSESSLGSSSNQQTPSFELVFSEGCATVDAAEESGNSEAFYYEIKSLRPSQPTYSLLNAEDKIAKAIAKKYATRRPDGTYKLKNDEGRAVYPLKKAFPVVNSPYG